MSKFSPPSLVHHFEPPENFIGTFGWLCGYSADSDFLNNALERFSRQTNAQRAYSGRIVLAILLDAGNPQISMTAAPGLLHLPIRKNPPFKLLHAKVAILGFQHESEQSRWCIRLIVSTGNWTKNTLEDSLDLAWRVDVDSQTLTDIHKNKERQQACVDVHKAWQMMVWLTEYFDDRLLQLRTNIETESYRKRVQVEKWLQKISEIKTSESSRFFDNRRHSLLAQLVGKISELADPNIRRNYLAMGSGFYEANNSAGLPTVLGKIVDSLQDADLLTNSAEIDVFINPLDCQCIVHSIDAIKEQGWSVRKAGQPPFLGKQEKFLHAKFLFSATYRKNSPYCNNAWLYLGSGNLTLPGFAQKTSVSGGNLEAGIIIAPQNFQWEGNKETLPQNLITNVLPMQWKDDLNSTPDKLSAGDGMPERDTQFIAAPVACLVWCESNGIGKLKVPDEAGNLDTTPFDVLCVSGTPCATDNSGYFNWVEAKPRQVTVRWFNGDSEFQTEVPVMDEHGRFAGTALPQLELEDAWWQLLNFPQPPEDEDLPTDTDDTESNVMQSNNVIGMPESNQYPARVMMQLIENIAKKQTAIVQVDWLTWCNRLEQTLIQAKDSVVLSAFRNFSINPLSPLWEKPFRPAYAETNLSSEGQCYEEMLLRLEQEWNVYSYKKLGSK
ncbi:hypothetical protein [Thiothrix unzii]|jgi:hypothetical protein|uniref:hypothetical protein n=1 Tax=Thiothrix unzii TaxID=111769 RepID=UPI002A3617B7|nr:hypothetical protein [Thiothrix unzii]MDX9987302.1 hypothetical protein [Thiothrix unzii]